jgi:hypothetical protein
MRLVVITLSLSRGAVIASVLATAVAAQTPAAPASAGPSAKLPAKPPVTQWTMRTPDGQPDLQGIWTNATLTPFERNPRQADKPFISEEEANQLERQAAQRAAAADTPGRTATTAGGAVGSYNNFWMDSGSTVLKTRQSSLVVDPPDGRVPITPEAERLRDVEIAGSDDHPEHANVGDICVTRGVPAGFFPAGYNNAYQIVQTPGYVVIVSEMIHEARIIPLNRPHRAAPLQSINGESVGRWEGQTLVVDTTNYNDRGMIATSNATGRMRGVRQSAGMHLVERFTRVTADTINYEATITDPNVYSRPWKVSMPFSRDDGYQIFEYACHEGNHAIANILKGARAQDKR